MNGHKVSLFAGRVYGLLGEIPRGKVTTYGELARALGCGSPRAVGQALRANPFAPGVPCHRVVRSDGALGGYQGEEKGAALRRKESLLREEGVTFLDDGRTNLVRSGFRFLVRSRRAGSSTR
jgi:methylated-DNA-[protein]-cysteine S-methyltransferase